MSVTDSRVCFAIDQWRKELPENYDPEQEVVRAVVRQAVIDIHSGCDRKKKYNYHTAKSWLYKNIDLLILAASIPKHTAIRFLETN